MRRIVIIVTVLFALVTLINSYNLQANEEAPTIRVGVLIP